MFREHITRGRRTGGASILHPPGQNSGRLGWLAGWLATGGVGQDNDHLQGLSFAANMVFLPAGG